MRFFLFPTAMVRPSSSLAKFSVVISNIPFPQFSSPPLYDSTHPPLFLRGNRNCRGAISPDLEDAILHCHYVRFGGKADMYVRRETMDLGLRDKVVLVTGS